MRTRTLWLALLLVSLVVVTQEACHLACKAGCWRSDNKAYCYGGCRNNYVGSDRTYLVFSSAWTCNCPGETYYSGGSSCPSCHYNCVNCNGAGSGKCTSCSASEKRFQSGSYCHCSPGFYDRGVALCGTCSYTCKTCISASTTCLSCNTGVNRYKSGYSCPCNSGYYDSGSSTCPICQYTCKTCVSSSTTCTSCQSSSTHYRSLSGNSCPCITGYYDIGSSVCSGCHYTCKTCVSAHTKCTSCQSSSTYHRTISGNTCPCNTGYYDSGSSVCSTCHFSCYKCTTSSTNCISCASSWYRSYSSSKCPCIAGYYEVNTATCGKCHYTCATCVGTSTNCTSCSSANHRYQSGNTCPCSNPYYDDGSSPSCPSCHHSCSSCTNSSTCVTCDSAKKRHFSSTTTYCLCDDRYYDPSVQTCTSCHSTCYRCSGTAASQCIACNSIASRILSGSTCNCMNGYYSTSTTLEQCSKCTYPCLTCVTASTQCTSCDTSQNRVLSSSTCPCKAKYFQNSTRLCQQCHSSCATCTNNSECVTCISSQGTIKDSSLLCACASNKYWTGSVCNLCNYKCLTCQGSSTSCRSCPLSSHRVYGSYACPCTEHYYDDGSNATCGTCSYSCLTCSSTAKTGCLTCEPSTLRIKSSTSCICPQFYYDDLVKPSCLKCHYSCNTCTNGSACSSCSSANKRVLGSTNLCDCLSTYYQDSQTCYICMGTCLTCKNNYSCSTCSSSLNRVLNSSTHLCDCNTGYYQNSGSTCSTCDIVCETCKQSGKCLKCKAGLYRQMTASTSTCDCKAGYVLNTTSNLCMGCHYSCQICVTGSDTECQTCNSTAFREYKSSSKSCDCKIGYYDDGINVLCKPCSYTCLSCIGSATNCTACPISTERVHVASSGTCLCAQHFFDTQSVYVFNNKICDACSYHCSSCSDPSSCLTCNSTHHRIFDSNSKCICSIGFYDDKSSNEKCLACPYQCLTCANSSECLTCSTTNFRALPATMCPCITGYFDTAQSQPLCLLCQYSCKTCTNGTQCTSCEISYSRVEDLSNNLCKCLGRFYDPGYEACASCSYSCLTCVTNPLNCLTCNSTALRTISASNSCDCNDGYYDSAVQQCAQCQYSCQTCGNARSCLSCNTTNHREYDRASALCVCVTYYYDTLNETQKCERCELTCLSCVDAVKCTTCDPTRFRSLNSTADYANNIDPFCPCLYGYYSLGNNDVCAPCHFSCAACNGNTVNKCLYCEATAKRTLSSKKCKCNSGYYDTNTTMQCPLCHYACKTCWDGANTTCFTCDPSFFMAIGNNTCFDTCPVYFFDNTTDMFCQECSPNCLRCLNTSNCTQCQAPTFLDFATAQCVAQCPLGWYGNQTTRTCQPCKQGCANCSMSNNCFQCVNTSYFVDNTSTLCYLCNSNCLTCFGASYKQCLSCQYPLYRNTQNICVPLLCPYGQYVHSVKGCITCGALFENSLRCNITHAQICHRSTLLENGACVSCTSVTGFHLDSTGDCNQICGDGLLIKYQCDDGNRINGDGCSSNCLIEKGWSCSNSTLGSVCTLSTSLSITLNNIHKYSRKNRILLVLKLSVDLFIDNNNFQLIITGLPISQYSVNIKKQSPWKLNQVQCQINYLESIAGKSIQLKYDNKKRLLQEIPKEIEFQGTQVAHAHSRMLLSVSFSVTINSFPPAQFIEPSTESFFDKCKLAIIYLSIALLGISILIVPRKYVLHSFSLSWVVPYFYLTFFHSTSYTNEWISSTLAKISWQALKGGFSIGDCCYSDSIKETSSQLFSNIGFIILAIVLSWLIYFIVNRVDSCSSSGKPSKVSSYVWYYLIALQLFVLMQVTYYSTYALSKYQLNNSIDSINITFSLFLLFSVVFFVISLWYVTATTYFVGSQDQTSSKATRQTQEKQISNRTEDQREYNMVINLSQIKESTRYDDSKFYRTGMSNSLDSKRPLTVKDSQHSSDERSEPRSEVESEMTVSLVNEAGESDSIFPFDYCYLYNNITTKSKYFLPLLASKLTLTAIFSVALEDQPLVMMVLITLLSAIFLVFMLLVRPFQSAFTNFRITFLEILIVTLNGIYCIYQYYATQLNYISWLEDSVVIGVIVVLSFGVFFGLIEHYRSWIFKVWTLCDGCCMYFRLMGSSKKVYADDQSQRVDIPVQPIEQGEVVEQDAFYARVLKKQAIKKQYRKERMIKEISITEKDFFQ